MPRLYRDFLESGDEKFLNHIRQHNKDDVMAMLHIIKQVRNRNDIVRVDFDKELLNRLRRKYSGQGRYSSEEIDMLEREMDKIVALNKPAREEYRELFEELPVRLSSKLERKPESIEKKLWELYHLGTLCHKS